MSINFSKTEEDTLRLWKEIDAFQTQLRLTEGSQRFTFYDGPPFGMFSPLRSLLVYGILILAYLSTATGNKHLPKFPFTRFLD